MKETKSFNEAQPHPNVSPLAPQSINEGSVDVVLETVSGASQIDEEEHPAAAPALNPPSKNLTLECKKLEAIKFLASQKVFMKVNPRAMERRKATIYSFDIESIQHVGQKPLETFM